VRRASERREVTGAGDTLPRVSPLVSLVVLGLAEGSHQLDISPVTGGCYGWGMGLERAGMAKIGVSDLGPWSA
jgi:hypothetical protein